MRILYIDQKSHPPHTLLPASAANHCPVPSNTQMTSPVIITASPARTASMMAIDDFA